jgi:hypothetical protein
MLSAGQDKSQEELNKEMITGHDRLKKDISAARMNCKRT